MQRRVIRPIIGSLLAFCILHQPGLDADEKSKEAGKADASQIQKLIRQLGDQDFKKREEASKKLVEIGPAALADLERALKNGDAEVMERARTCLKEINDAEQRAKNIAEIPDLIKKLGAPDQGVRGKTAVILRDIGAPAIPALKKALKDPNKRIRTGAALSFLYMTNGGKHDIPDLKDAVPALMDALDDPEPLVAQHSAVALGYIGADAKPAVPKLLKLFTNEKKPDHVRFCAGRALGHMGASAEAAIPTLLEYLKDKSEVRSPRIAAIYALGDIGCRTKEVIPAMIAVLRDKDDKDGRRCTADAIGVIGREARAAIPYLLEALKIEDRDDPDYEWALRCAAARSLGKFGAEAKESVPALISALRKAKKPEREGTNATFIFALARIGPEAKEAVPVLQDFARRHSGAEKRWATTALDAIEGRKKLE